MAEKKKEDDQDPKKMNKEGGFSKTIIIKKLMNKQFNFNQ
jgi:hypothetical protein